MIRHVLFSAALAISVTSSALAEDPVTVTSDTSEYCLTLAGRIDAAGEMPPRARLLWIRGRSMCERGHVRMGLAHLRRAALMIRGEAE